MSLQTALQCVNLRVRPSVLYFWLAAMARCGVRHILNAVKTVRSAAGFGTKGRIFLLKDRTMFCDLL